MNAEILDKFSTHLKNALVRAYALAQELRQPAIEPQHLMYALAAKKGSIASGGEGVRRRIVDDVDARLGKHVGSRVTRGRLW